ncbi:drug/metabolite transporter (DMT)-like permease [Murinocardiopsis flavida]|uniref:Drug/metabolite transporter (DMT)-like permease n=1 Tax=Murinocardiopsis flavida TaxID=645275 RepID=A0A2P8D3M5_9ACTN|nr:DMT family transporter [Murinocardiopsis flavida]PSK91817.1 drug/metabolite transporter (DMT)-like permease [Murinocardiopsis flavida]
MSISPARTPAGAPAATAARPAIGWRPKFLLLALVWGTSFVFIGVAAQALDPIQITLGRMLTGLLPLAGVLLLRGGRLPREPRIWLHLSVTSFFLNVVPFTLFGHAGQLIPSALSGICNAATPLFALVFSLVLLTDERPTRARLTGLLLGFVGVLVVFGVWTGFAGAGSTGMLLAVAAALCYGIGTPYLRRFVAGSGHTPLELSTAQLLAGSVQIAVAAALFTDAPGAVPLPVIGSVVALGALGTGLAYVLQYAIVREAGATVAATVTYLVPVVAIAAGVLLLGEDLAWNQPVGALVIIAGAALAQYRPRRARR